MKLIQWMFKKTLMVVSIGVVVVPLLALGLFLYISIKRQTPSEPAVGNIIEQPYACGRFGDKVMWIDRRYVYLSTVNYEGVNYWTPNYREINATKGCDDQLVSVTFSVKWPEMIPHNTFDPKERDAHLNISIGRRGPGLEHRMDEPKVFFDYTDSITRYFSRAAGYSQDGEKNYAEIMAEATFNLDMGLYEAQVHDDERSRGVVYWEDVEGKRAVMMIRCEFFKLREDSSCHLNYHIPDYGHHTSQMEISFKSKLLPHWENVVQDSLQLIQSFTIPPSSPSEQQE